MKSRPYLYLFVVGLLLIFLPLSEVEATEITEDEAERNKVWEDMVEMVKESQQLIQKGELEAARKRLNQVSDRFLDIAHQGYFDRIEEMQVMLDTIIKTKEELSRIEVNMQQAQYAVQRLVLALDAVSHKKQPLWLNYYPSIKKAIDDVKLALEGEDQDPFYHQLVQLSIHYEYIRPSLFVSHPPGQIEKLDALIKHLLDSRSEYWGNKDRAKEMLEELEKEMDIAFFKQTEPNQQSLFSLIVWIGAMICSVLAYVAWKKYRAEHKEEQVIAWNKVKDQ